MLAGNESRLSAEMAATEVHLRYLIKSDNTQNDRIRSLELQLSQALSTQSQSTDHHQRLQRLEDQARLLRVVAGILMLALASSGVMGGTAARLGKALLGII